MCAAAVLCVVEPMSTGIGGDAFALVWQDGRLDGLNASGRAPAAADPDALGREMPFTGPQSVTVPGAVAGWQALLERHGTWGLDRCLADAIDSAGQGFELTPVIAGQWAGSRPTWRRTTRRGACSCRRRRAAPPGATRNSPRRCAGSPPRGRTAFYRGPVAEAIAAATWLDEADLGAMQADWVEPLRIGFGDATVCELPPNGQGAAALQAMGIARDFDLGALSDADRVHVQAEAMKLAFADAYPYIADEPLPAGYLDEAYLPRAAPRSTRRAPPTRGAAPAARRHRLPPRRRPRPDGVLVHPEHLHRLRLARRGARHRRDAAEPRRLLHPRGGPSEPARAAAAAVPHHHPRHAARRRRPGRAVRR